MTNQQDERRLTTHVLDTSHGRPAAGLRIVLSRLESGGAVILADIETNADGRCDTPLLNGRGMSPGRYELVFHAGDYLRRSGVTLDAPAFLDEVPVRFGIADADAHYHVPLLLSAYGYGTYRGS